MQQARRCTTHMQLQLGVKVSTASDLRPVLVPAKSMLCMVDC
jgi:hypothetical protein